jgi:hypothetical protein
LYRWLGRPQSQSGHYGEEKNPCFISIGGKWNAEREQIFPGIEHCFQGGNSIV